MPETHLPHALLFTMPACPHCPAVKQGLTGLLREGLLEQLEVVDASQEMDRARELGVKGVPWLRLGEFELDGQMSPGELRHWAELAALPDGLKHYYYEMLKSGRRAKVEDSLRQEPDRAAWLAELVTDPEASMAVRLGIGAVLEELQGTGLTEAMAPPLALALAAAEARDRADIAHFLSLIGGGTARQALAACLQDPDPEVREIAQEALSGSQP